MILCKRCGHTMLSCIYSKSCNAEGELVVGIQCIDGEWSHDFAEISFAEWARHMITTVSEKSPRQ